MMVLKWTVKGEKRGFPKFFGFFSGLREGTEIL
jgi:hypothetical protein